MSVDRLGSDSSVAGTCYLPNTPHVESYIWSLNRAVDQRREVDHTTDALELAVPVELCRQRNHVDGRASRVQITHPSEDRPVRGQ